MPISQRAVLLAAGLSLLAACTASPSATAPATSAGPAITAPAAPSSASPTATTTTEAAAACPSGEYTMTSFAATGTNGALGKGNGGDVSAEFENGRYDIDFDDDEPIAITLDDDTGELLVDGSIEGTYTGTDGQGSMVVALDGDTLTLTTDDGEVTELWPYSTDSFRAPRFSSIRETTYWSSVEFEDGSDMEMEWLINESGVWRRSSTP